MSEKKIEHGNRFTAETMKKRMASRRKTKIKEAARPVKKKFLVRGRISGVDY